jgi:DNA-binding winged helix-turn-helix (wHTH) protein
LPRQALLECDGVSLDAYGLLRSEEKWVALSNIESEVIALLLADLGEVATVDTFVATLWPNRERSAACGPLKVHIHRLRKRIEPLRLRITTIHGKGYLLHHA